MRKVVFMIDGWFMRKQIYRYKAFYYCGPEIRKYCLKHLRKEDYLYRIFYYDTEPLDKKGHNPITKKAIDFASTPVAVAQRELLESIKSTPDFALRLGKTVWKNNEWILAHDRLKDSGPQNLDGMISYTWRLKTGGPSGKNEKELSAII